MSASIAVNPSTLGSRSAVAGKQLRTVTSARPAVTGRESRLNVSANIKLIHVKQTTAQKIAAMQYNSGYITYEPTDIEFKKNTVVIGACTQPGSEVDVILPVPTISSEHARLFASKDSVLVKDLNSTNGTYVDGDLIEGGSTRVVFPGSKITFDAEKGIEYIVELDTSFEEAPTMTPNQVVAKVASEAPAYSSEATLEARVEDRTSWIENYKMEKMLDAAVADISGVQSVRDSWKAKFRANPELIPKAPEPEAAPAAAVSPMSSEASLEDRLEDREEWIANYRASSVSPMSSEASLEARLEDRSAWIAKYRAASISPMSSEAPLEARIEDRATWIENYRYMQELDAAVAKLSGVKSVQEAWKAKYKANPQLMTKSIAWESTSEASWEKRIKDRAAWIQNYKDRVSVKV